MRIRKMLARERQLRRPDILTFRAMVRSVLNLGRWTREETYCLSAAYASATRRQQAACVRAVREDMEAATAAGGE